MTDDPDPEPDPAPVVRPTRPIDGWLDLTLPPGPAYGVGIGGGLAFDL